MYKGIFYEKRTETIHLWDDELGYVTRPYEPYAYVVDKDGTQKTITGLKVKRVTDWTSQQEKHGLVFEHDVPPVTRYLVDNYWESDEPSKGIITMFFDIEVAKGDKYSKPTEALNVVTSVSFYDTKFKKYVCYLLDKNNRAETKLDGKILKCFGTERELLTAFLSYWGKLQPTIVSGWNISGYDVPYLYHRIDIVLGKNKHKLLSPIGTVYFREQGFEYITTIAGVAIFDYMQLYKKFTYNEEPSYALDYIANLELGHGKIKYEGTLDDLYRNDIEKFVDYNIVDVELCVELDKKLDFIEISRGICHKGHVGYDDFQYSSRYLDGAIQTRCKRNGLVTTSRFKTDDESPAIGAFVKPPTVGLHEWMYSIDLQSLYPSIIMTCNISPETQLGYIKNWDKLNLVAKILAADKFDSKKLSNFGYIDDDQILEVTPIIKELFSDKSANPVKYSKQEFIKYINDTNASISSAGVIFHNEFKGIVPSILSDWFDERVLFKNKCKEFDKDSAGFVYYDRKQLITKILLNSLYGVLLLPSFRYYDKRNGESVTLSGQSIIKYADVISKMYYSKYNNEYKENPVRYSDTDSLYLDARPLIVDIESKSINEIISETTNLSETVTEFINNGVKWLTTHHFHSKENRIKFNQEKIIRRGFWGQAKKRYALLGIDPKTMKTDVTIKGFDSVRSSFPKTFRKMLSEVITDILHDFGESQLNDKIRQFRIDYKNSPLSGIMLPSSVKEISKFKNVSKGVPIHVKSAINYNSLLDLHNIRTLSKISDGDKILYAYVKQNPFGFETIALKGQGEDPQEIIDFAEKFVDREKVFQNTFVSKLESIWEDLGWGKVNLLEKNNFF